MRDRFIATLSCLAEADPRVMLITGDLGFGVLDSYRARFPRQFINAGVAEQNMTLVATGLAQEGHTVFTYSIANFPTLRCLEMIRNGAAYHDVNVNIVAVGGGFSYGQLGMSHFATEDLAILRAIPQIDVFSPSSLRETEAVTIAAARRSGTSYLRLDKSTGPDGDEDIVVGRPRWIRSGADVAIFTTGGIMGEVVAAADKLAANGLHASVISIHTLHPVDEAAIVGIASEHPVIVTVEEHGLRGGLSSMLLEVLADHSSVPPKFLRIGLPPRFPSEVGSQQYLREVYKMDASSITDRIKHLLVN